MSLLSGPNHQPVHADEPADLVDATNQMASDADSLAGEHPLFTDLLVRNGLPPLWRREATFETVVRFILEQQVSLASANAVFRRLDARLGGVSPQGVFSSTDAEMRSDGFSRQKTGYARGIANELLSGDLELPQLGSEATEARHRLMSLRGIGPWTASCYMLFVCGARDAWPSGDRALYVSMSRNLDLATVPNRESGDKIAAAWGPWRSTAAKMLWYDYLGGANHVPIPDAGFIEGTGKVLP